MAARFTPYAIAAPSSCHSQGQATRPFIPTRPVPAPSSCHSQGQATCPFTPTRPVITPQACTHPAGLHHSRRCLPVGVGRHAAATHPTRQGSLPTNTYVVDCSKQLGRLPFATSGPAPRSAPACGACRRRRAPLPYPLMAHGAPRCRHSAHGLSTPCSLCSPQTRAASAPGLCPLPLLLRLGRAPDFSSYLPKSQPQKTNQNRHRDVPAALEARARASAPRAALGRLRARPRACVRL
jgi:hypothetical protein